MYPELKLSLVNESVFFDEQLYELLTAIEDTHSVRDACEKAGISYSTAWNRIRRLEAQLGCPAVNRTQGGAIGAGRSELTEKGRRLCVKYSEFRGRLIEDMEEGFHHFFSGDFLRDIILISAGETLEGGRHSALSDPTLSDRGRIQSCLLWRELSVREIGTVCAADDAASGQTAEIIFGMNYSGAGLSLPAGIPEDSMPDFIKELMDSATGNIALVAPAPVLTMLVRALFGGSRPTPEFAPGTCALLSCDGGCHLNGSPAAPHPELGRLLCTKILHSFYKDEAFIGKTLKRAERGTNEAFFAGEKTDGLESALILRALSGAGDKGVPVSEILMELEYPDIAGLIDKLQQ